MLPNRGGLLWILFFAAELLWPWWSSRASGRHSLLAAAVLPPLPLYCTPYFFSRWQPVTLHVESSFTRLLLHLALPALMFVATVTATAWSALRRVRAS